MNVVQVFARVAASVVLGASLYFGIGISVSFAQQSGAEEEPQTIGQYARHYRVYRRDIDILSELSFMTASEVHDAYQLILSYEPMDLTRGWIAHNAIVASRAPGFMEMVRIEARSTGREQFFLNARAPGYMWELSTHTAAINFIFDGIYQDAREARAVGRVLSERAYAYMDGTYGSRLPAGTAVNANEIIAAEASVDNGSGGRSYVMPYRAQNVMERVLELAARISLEGSGGRNMNAGSLLFDHQETNRCLRWANLNLAQCVAASRTPAEEAYCTGLHGVEDVSDCWGWMVSADGIVDRADLGR